MISFLEIFLLLVLATTFHSHLGVLQGIAVEAKSSLQQDKQQWENRSSPSPLTSSAVKNSENESNSDAADEASSGNNLLASSPSTVPPILASSRDGNKRTNGNTEGSRPTTSGSGNNSAIIISTVDGIIYTLDAFNGNLRGMVQSGGPLVSTSSDEQSHNPYERHYHQSEDDEAEPENPDNDEDSNHSKSNRYQHEIIPGLDGALYSYSLTNNDNAADRLHLLPVTIQDIIDNGPISTCIDRPFQHDDHDEQDNDHSPNYYSGRNDEPEEICGLVMGQSSTKLIALDTTHGTVQWIHDTSSSYFSAHRTGGFSSSRGDSTVLLQREDYNVKHIDADSGEEGWRVHLGSIKALDVPNRQRKQARSKHASGNRNGNVGSNTMSSGNGGLFRIQSQTRFPNAGSNMVGDTNDDHRNKNRNDGPTDSASLIFDQRLFPSVAFGSDGLTLYCMDEMHNVLWLKKFESVISSVYGVSGNMDWVDLQVLDTVDEEDIKHEQDDDGNQSEHDNWSSGGLYDYNEDGYGVQSTNAIPLSIGTEPIKHGENNEVDTALSLFRPPSTFHPLIEWPLNARRPIDPGGTDFQLRLPSFNSEHDDRNEVMCRSENYHALVGQHMSSLFVASPAQSMYEDESFSFEDEDNAGYYDDEEDDNDDGGILIREEDIPFIQELFQKYHSLNISHKTEHGLFLTWKMVAVLITCVLSGVVGGRYLYLRKKRTWMLQSSPAFVPRNLEHEGLEVKPRMTPNDIHIMDGSNPVPALELERAHTTDSSVMKAELLPSGPAKMHKSASLPDLTFHSKDTKEASLGHNIVHNNKSAGDSTSGIQTQQMSSTAAETIIPSSKALDTAVAGDENDEGSLLMEGVSNVDGIPLIRYSRYNLEFVELSALGKGGFGTVFKCKNALDGREYAVKKVLIKSTLDSNGQLPEKFSERLERVLREVKILAFLDHRNIVRYYTSWLEVGDDSDENHLGMNRSTSEPVTSHALSADLIAGSSTLADHMSSANNNGGMSPSRTNHLQSALNQHHGINGNPLGWDTFLPESAEFDESSCDSQSNRGLEKIASNRWSSTSLKSEEDLGFTFDRNNALKSIDKSSLPLPTIQDYKHAGSDSSSSSSSSSGVSSSSGHSSVESESKWSDGSEEETASVNLGRDGNKSGSGPNLDRTTDIVVTESRIQKHILYIQMQLSQKTLLDYFVSREGHVEIPLSLKIFGHIARGVKHVHSNGLIHRDLKPSNCFMDEDDTVKIGDFGLSRESGAQNDDIEPIEITTTMKGAGLGHDQENTIGVGTASYASPEQISGSDYDSSSDVYSLGIILFELCYPMSTGMERIKVFESIRRRSIDFPSKWHLTVAKKFLSIHTLLISMLSHDPKTRPSAAEVTTHVESLLSEYTVHSLDRSLKTENSIFVRVETVDNEGALGRTIKLIKDSTSLVHILQYSLISRDSKKIMEFALSIEDDTEKENSDRTQILNTIFRKLNESDEINLVRQINEVASGVDRSSQKRTLSM